MAWTHSVQRALRMSLRIAWTLGMGMSLCACAAARPNARILNDVPKSAPALYQRGWHEGCETGLSGGGNEFYRTFYHNTITPQLVDNADYYQGWLDAEPYCRHYVMGLLFESKMLGKNPAPPMTQSSDMGGVLGLLDNWGPTTVFSFVSHFERPGKRDEVMDRMFGWY
jgi:hypothetical protein